jgi:hypothetical protein
MEKLIKLPKEQELYLNEYLNIYGFNELIFLDKSLLIEYLTGYSQMRLKDYKGNSQDFYDDIYLSFTCSDIEKQKYIDNSFLLENFIRILKNTEFYELLHNVTFFHDEYFKIGLEYSKHLKANKDIAEMLGDTNFNVFPDES